MESIKYSQIPLEEGNLRDYQLKCKHDVFKAWDSYDSVMLQMPTGTGKTFLFTSIIHDIIRYYKSQHREINILVVAHRMELLDQISESLSFYGIPHGFIQGSREQHLWQRVQVASIMSVLTERNEMNVQRLDFDFIIVDEAHHSLANTYKKLFETFPRAKKLGVTATPWRFNHETFLSLYQILITTPQVIWFINHGYLSDFDYVSLKPDTEMQKMIDNTEVAQTGDFVNAELDIAFNNQRIRSKLLASYQKFAKGRKGIVYAINKEHAANIASMYCQNGVNAVAIDCDTPKDDRKRIVDDFKAGNISVMVNVEIFTEGFNCPDVSFIQLARPTRSLALYLQQVGRGLRAIEGKEKTIILDNVGLYNYFGLPDANRKWQHHFTGKELEDEAKEERPDYQRDPDYEREERTYDEDDEEMMIVRGSADIADPSFVSEESPKPKVEPLAEYTICDYYYIYGNSKAFKVYPFMKKRGKRTEGVGSCLYAYDESKHKLEFGKDVSENMKILACDAKAQVIVMFAASLAGVKLQDVLKADEGKLSLLDVLKKINEKCMSRVSRVK